MTRLRSVLGYTGAILTLLAAILTPFVLLGWFQQTIGSAGLRIHPMYSGGEVVHVIRREGYSIRVNQPVPREKATERFEPFVQLAWTPAKNLPAHVADEVDLDADGQTDVLVQFDVPKDPSGSLTVDVTAKSGRAQTMHVQGTSSMYALIAHVKDAIVVRVPVAESARFR